MYSWKYQKYKVLFFSVITLLYSCSHYPKDVERALKLAGDNRAELERVLEHYRTWPEDSLKYRAACFLVANMPGHYTFTSALMDTFRQRIHGIAVEYEGIVRPSVAFERKYGPLPGYLETIHDIKVITSDYLIENIDFSFEVWQQNPWGKHLTFDQFCDEILPYRLDDEPLENWKKDYYREFRPDIDSLPPEQKNDPVAACSLIYHHLRSLKWLGQININAPHLGASLLLRSRYGSCREMADMYAYALRAVGIPAGVDIIVQNPVQAYRTHYWNYMRDTTGHTIGFDYHELTPSREKTPVERKRGKVYRTHYGIQSSSLPVKYQGKAIPDNLNSVYLSDVSGEYFEGATIDVAINKLNGNILSLGVFDNKNWIPVDVAEIRDCRAIFSHVEPDIVYCPVFYTNGVTNPVTYPLITLPNGGFKYLVSDTTRLRDITIDRKYPFPVNYELYYRSRPLGGQFQGANKSDFSDAIILYTINREANLKYCTIPIHTSRKFKYLRYLSAPGAYNSMAEVRFISSDRLLTGKIIGTESWKGLKDMDRSVIFDKDPLTYFYAAEPDGGWAGIELDTPQHLDSIVYLFRNDDNSVYPGQMYELFYFTGQGMVSLGCQTGDERQCLTFKNVPENALLILRNLSKGKEERPFTYENGKQVWW